MSRYDALVRKTTQSILESPGATDPKLRLAVFHNRLDEVPPLLKGYVEKVRQRAYKVSDEDVDVLRQNGYSEDEIFEITAAAAAGAAIMRLEHGMSALRGAASRLSAWFDSSKA